MNETPTADIRERVAHWVQETLKLLPHLPPLLHGDEAAKIAELQRECERQRKELDEMRREHDRLRIDRDEVTQALSRLMDSVQPINQIAQRLGLRRSPFEREAKPASPAATPAPGAPTSVPKSS
ncbi:MAG: hypothetical protein ACREJ9_02805 [Candidatus Rokuibacteriota bacterium]